MRRFSPVLTIGGGTVLDPSPDRRRRKDSTADLDILETGSLPEKIAAKVKKAGLKGMNVSSITGWIKAEIPAIEQSLGRLKSQGLLIQLGDTLFQQDIYSGFSRSIAEALDGFHKKNPLSPGMPKEELRAQMRMRQDIWGNWLSSLDSVVVDKEVVRLRSFMTASSGSSPSASKIRETLERAKFQPPAKEELAESLALPPKTVTDMLKLMGKEGTLVRINDSMYITAAAYKELISLLRAFFGKKPEMTVAEFRDILGTTRKYALPFLEYLDSNNITLRVGDVRKFLLK